MKHLLTLALALGGSTAALAQTPITITPAQYPVTATSNDHYQAVSLTGLTPPTTGANQSWDYRSLTRTGNPMVDTYDPVGANPPFAGAVRAYDYDILGAAATQYEGFEAGGFGQLGTTIPAQTLQLGGGNVIDVPAQSFPISNVRVPLPMTSTTRLTRTNRTATRSFWTIPAAGLSQAPMVHVQRIVALDSVVGWGTIRIPVAGSTTGSAPIPVLLEMRRFVRQDSFYLGGQPAPAALLTGSGLTQGGFYREYRHNFYRQNSPQSLLSIGYSDAAYSVPLAAFVSTEASLPLGTQAARETGKGLVAWPNPAAVGQPLQFTLGSNRAGQPLHISLRDATGRVVAEVTTTNGHPAALPTLPAGLYLAEAEAADGTRASRRVVLK